MYRAWDLLRSEVFIPLGPRVSRSECIEWNLFRLSDSKVNQMVDPS